MDSAITHFPRTSTGFPDPLATLDPAFIDGIQAGILVIDRGHRILLSNKFVHDWIKRSREDLCGQRCYHLMHGADEVCLDCPSAVTFRTGETARTVHTGLDKEGGTTYAEVVSHPIFGGTGEVLYVIEYVTDVSERFRFEREILDRNQRLAALNAISAIVGSSLDVDEVLHQCLAKLLEVTQGEGGGILLLNESDDELVLRAHLGMSQEFVTAPQMVRVKRGGGLTWAAATSGRPLIVHNLRDDPRTQDHMVKKEGIQAVASVPLRSRDRVVGVVNIIRRENREFVAEDVDLL